MLVSEVMSQQTQIDRVVAKFGPFIERFPTPMACATASLGDLLVLWQGLGYPRRCRNLHAAAVVMERDHGGQVPETLDELLALPGVGPYTARAVLAFANNADVGVVDTNIARVFSRVVNRELGRRELQEIADETVPRGHGWEWNQVVMDFGARLCSAHAPLCEKCPIRSLCSWQGGPDPDPAPGTAGTSKPQARFEGSDRQARGRLLRALTAGGVKHSHASRIMGLPAHSDRSVRVVQSLLEDGLMVASDSMYLLP
ncbi:MAG: A/G-specific adenine glycosylase [Actinomycetota bacterium]